MNDNPVTDPIVFRKAIGRFILAAYGDYAVPPEKLTAYVEACEYTAGIQADLVVAHDAGISMESAYAQIDSGRGTHDEVAGFGALLNKFLPENFLPPGLINQALTLQACGRTIFVMNGRLAPEIVTPPKDGDEKDTVLQEVQARLSGLLARRLTKTFVLAADQEALRTTNNALNMLAGKYEQAAPSLSKRIDALHQIGVGLAPYTRPIPYRPF